MHIGKKGFTLVEIIVSLAIMSIVAGAIGAFVIAGNNSYMRGNKELTLQEEAQLTANQLIDLIIDVERGIYFEPSKTVDAVDVDGNVAANDVPGAELILRNNDNVYMVRWQGGSGYDSANQLYLYEVANGGKDADGNIIWGDPETAAPSLMAEYVTAFNVDLTDLAKRKVKLEMTFDYQDKTYQISETIKLRNDLSGEESTDYAWITGLTIDPTSAEVNRGAVQKFNYHLTGDEAAVAKGVTWKVTKADGSSCNSSIDSTGKLTIASDEEIGDGVLIVTCTAVADPTKVASATVSVKKVAITSLTISPKEMSIVRLNSGETGYEQDAIGKAKRIDFTCTMDGDEDAIAEGVDWKVTYADDTSVAAGTVLKPTGMTASLVAGTAEKLGPQILKVTCTSKADSSKSDTAWIDVTQVNGQYTVDLILDHINTYKFQDGSQEKTGKMAVIECLPSWANYREGYPYITWKIVGDSTGYTFESVPGNIYQQNLYCSYHINTTVTVQATIQLDKNITVVKTRDILLDDLKDAVIGSVKQPYIDSKQFVMDRNGMVECWLENYEMNDGEKVTWRIANDVELGLAPSADKEALEGSMDEDTFNDTIRSKRLVGFTKSKELVEGSVAGNYDHSTGSYNVFPSAQTTKKGEHVYIWSKYTLPWNQEYYLTLQAIDQENNIIAEAYIYIPKAEILFPSGSRYLSINLGQDILPRCKCPSCQSDPTYNHWNGYKYWDSDKQEVIDARGIDNQWLYIDIHGFNNGYEGLASAGALFKNLKASIVGEEEVASGTEVDLFVPETGTIQVSINGMEKNKNLYINFYDEEHYNDQAYRIDRALMIQWNTIVNGMIK